MNIQMINLAEKLGIDHAKLPREELAEIVCEKALKCIEAFEGTRTIDGLQMEPNINYVGINIEQMLDDVEHGMNSGLLSADQLNLFCDQSDKASQVIAQLYGSLESIAPHRTIGLQNGSLSIWRNGLGKVIDSMLDNRHLFENGLNKTTRQIRAYLKRREANAAAVAKDAADKSGIHVQIGMVV